MPSADQRNAVRYDLALSATEMPDAEIDTLYTRAITYYPASELAQEAQVRLFAVDRLWMEAAKRNDYRQNQSEEKVSQIFDHLETLRKKFASDLETALSLALPNARWGSLKRVIPRLVEYPSTYSPTPDDGTDVSTGAG